MHMWRLFVIVCSSARLLSVPREGCASYAYHFLGIFTCFVEFIYLYNDCLRCCVLGVKRVPGLHFSVVCILWSYAIIELV